MGKGSGTPSPTEMTQVTSNLPEYARPYYEQALERSLYESARPYEAFPGQRIADFSSPERAAMQGMAGMAAAGSPTQFLHASNIAENIGYQPAGIGTDIASRFRPGPIQSQYLAPDIDPGYAAPDLSQGYQAGARGSGYTGQPAFGTEQFGPGFTPGTVADPETIQRYMNPYQQMVTDVEKREAARQSNIMGSQIGQQAAQAGGMGGYREAIMQAERERNLGQQLGDIQTRGNQAAFEQAQRAFEADRAARYQAGQMGLQMGTAREAALQAGERFGQQQFVTNEELRQRQQAADLSVYQAEERARQQAANMGMSAQQIEDSGRKAADDARLAAQRFNIDAQRQRAELGLRGLTADQAGTAQSLKAAGLLGQFGGQQQQMDYERLKNLQASGEIQRQLSQEGLTMGYQDFLRQQAFPREQVGFFNQVLRGLPIQAGSTTAAYGGPGPAQRLLGHGIAGVGLYNSLMRPRG